MTVEEAREVLAREGDKQWAVKAAADVRQRAAQAEENGDPLQPSPQRIAGRIAAVCDLLVVKPPKRTKAEIEADKKAAAKRKAEREAKKAAAAKK